ncbi:MAG: CapA family protein [Dehalococcoidia bacterium]
MRRAPFVSLIALATLLAACSGDALPPTPPPAPASTATATPATASQPAPSLTATEAARPSPAPAPTITIAAVGDLMFARDVTTLMQQHGAAYPFERVLPLFAGADLLIGNLEGTFTDRGEALDKYYTFRTPPALAETLRLAGFDAVSLANNHSYDFGLTGLKDTLDALAAAGVTSFGAGLNRERAYLPAVLGVDGITVALLGFDDIGETRFAEGDGAGVARASLTNEPEIALAATWADYVIVSLHAGTEYSPEPTSWQRALARNAIDAGADVVIGHHPHVLQPWERYNGGLIIYSLGNFVFDLDPDDLATLGSGPFETAVAMITLSPDAPPQVEFRPAYIDPVENRPRPASATEAAAIGEALREVAPFSESASQGRDVARPTAAAASTATGRPRPPD